MVRLVTATRETTCIYFLGKTCVDSDLFIFHYYYYLLTKKKKSCRIGLGTLLSGARLVSDGMLQAAAEW